MAEQLTANGVPVYRDSAGVLREYTTAPSQGGGSGALSVPTITQTYNMDKSSDGTNNSIVAGGPVTLLSIDAYNARNGGIRVMLFDKPSIPTMQDDPLWTIYIPGLTTGSREWVLGLKFTSGLSYMLVADDAPGLMAGDIIGLNMGYMA